MTQALVRQALEAKLNTWAQAQTPAIVVAWENVPFTPPATRYVRSNILPAPTVSQTLAKTHVRYSGIYQVTLVMPNNSGPGAADALIDSLRTAYTPATLITQGTLKLYIIEPASPAPPLQEGDRYIIPVSIQYEAHTVPAPPAPPP
jgi:hypothetical protein